MDWNEAMRLVRQMYADGLYRDALLIAAGCYLGLRISDLLVLRWKDLLSRDFIMTERKTGKDRVLRVSASLKRFAGACRNKMGRPPEDSFVFVRDGDRKPISRQAVDLMLKKVRVRYQVKSAKVFSSHTLRKTFGRRVWLRQCEQGRGEQALVLLCDVFGHSNVSITKRYLGIRREEILSVYDTLDAQ